MLLAPVPLFPGRRLRSISVKLGSGRTRLLEDERDRVNIAGPPFHVTPSLRVLKHSQLATSRLSKQSVTFAALRLGELHQRRNLLGYTNRTAVHKELSTVFLVRWDSRIQRYSKCLLELSQDRF